MTRISRRALLTGGAGLAGLTLGAGATEAATVATATTAPPDVPTPGEELMTEHGVLKRVLLAYRAIGDRLAAGDAVSGNAVSGDVVTDAGQVVADFIESFHEGLEEAYVFPRVAATQGALVRTLLVQHDRGRHLTARILALGAADLTRAAARKQLRADLAAFVRMYEPHEAWEDTVIYPELRRRVSERERTELAERFHDLQNRQYGDDALAQVLARVHGVEQQLGIADLAAFTPAL